MVGVSWVQNTYQQEGFNPPTSLSSSSVRLLVTVSHIQQPLLPLGLERVAGLNKDISMFEKDFGLKVPEYSASAKDYASYLLSLARDNEPVFICHFYNYYFGETPQ